MKNSDGFVFRNSDSKTGFPVRGGVANKNFVISVVCIAFLMATNVCAAKPGEVKTPYGVLKTEREKLVVLKEMCKSEYASYPYKLAWEIRDILNKLFPFHGCDRASAHRSLLDCCVSGEATVESVVEDEIRRAHELYTTHHSLRSIQTTLLEEFAQYYPAIKPSNAYNEYIQKYHLPVTQKRIIQEN